MDQKKEDVVHAENLEHVNSVDRYHDDIEAIKGRDLVVDDDARGYVDPNLIITDEENKKMRWKIHKRVLPLMCLAYITQALDKGTLGPASIMGWQESVGAKGQDYALTSTMLWAGIIAGEPIANQLVRKLPLGKLLGTAMMIWTALLIGLAFSLTIPPVFAIRFLLGFFESLFGPVLLSITVQWYLKDEQPFVSSIWQSMLGLSNVIMSFFGFVFYHIKGKASGLVGWQWLFITVAIISFCAAIITFLFLPDSPTRARFLTEQEKVKYVERVRSNGQGLKHKVFKKDQAWEAFKDPYTYLLFALALFNTLVVGGINTFSSLLINKAFGFNVMESNLLSMPLGAMVVLTYMIQAYLVTKTKQTLLVMIGTVIPNIIGSVMLITIAPKTNTRGVLIFAFYLMQFFQSTNPSIFSLLSRNVSGQTKKSITYASTYIAWAGGNAIASQLFQSKWAPRYLNSLYIHLGLYGCFIITCIVTRTLLVLRNKKKEAAMSSEDNTNSRAFEDLTDIQNPEFRYAL
ncbi:hypothetical protein I316_07187 [Kwoniella heveanensis BCC8398]|uniref:Major facilitator superfamily (MFS) profile domain-containing protein n=1 Tax=Kwoniella heveanensis BCC8398 TaxID=1296120 RepID=A0A1B9GJP3_9TREE|nr:hypothetical protein I316_07187 [Kwoniella heveanensis BCC8398]